MLFMPNFISGGLLQSQQEHHRFICQEFVLSAAFLSTFVSRTRWVKVWLLILHCGIQPRILIIWQVSRGKFLCINLWIHGLRFSYLWKRKAELKEQSFSDRRLDSYRETQRLKDGRWGSPISQITSKRSHINTLKWHSFFKLTPFQQNNIKKELHMPTNMHHQKEPTPMSF